MTRKDWLLVAAALKKARPASAPGQMQHDTDCWAIAAAFKQEADRQGQKFDPARFVADCGAG